MGSAAPQMSRRGGVPLASGPGLTLAVHNWDAGEPELLDDSVRSSFTAYEGSRALLLLTCTDDQPIPVPRRADAERRLDATIEAWRRWLGSWDYDGGWPEQVARSALALKLLVYAPLGAIVAAPTTSLPERIGGDRNFDYRYMWVRDTSFTLEALIRLGLPEQVHESYACLVKAVRTTAPDLHPFYSVLGRQARRCEELDLGGYRDSRPVAIRKCSRRQLQLGSWGDLLETSGVYVRSGGTLDAGTGELLSDCVDRLCVIWSDEDSGIWELDDCAITPRRRSRAGRRSTGLSISPREARSRPRTSGAGATSWRACRCSSRSGAGPTS
jgi:GH15 family glucan-1,4-alpha-glucosidase